MTFETTINGWHMETTAPSPAKAKQSRTSATDYGKTADGLGMPQCMPNWTSKKNKNFTEW